VLKHLGLVTSLVLLATLPAACATETADEDDEGAESAELSAAKVLHAGPVEMLGASKSRVLFVARTAAGTEVHYASRTLGDKILATYPANETVAALPGKAGHFALTHNAAIGPAAVSVVDLDASKPVLKDVVATPTARGVYLAEDGTVAYAVATSNWLEKDVFVRSPDGTVRQAPGRATSEPQLSDDGRILAYRSGDNVVAFSPERGTSTTTPVGSYGSFVFAQNRLIAANPGASKVLALSPDAAPKELYSVGAISPRLELRTRPDGKVLVFHHDPDSFTQDPQFYASFIYFTLLDPVTGTTTDLANGAKAPHVGMFQHVLSADGQYLLDWYPATIGQPSGSVWLHAITPAGLQSTKVLDGVTVGVRTAAGFIIRADQGLGARCSFGGRFVRCTKGPRPAGQSWDTIVTFTVDAPTKQLPQVNFERLRGDGARVCWATQFSGTFGCLDTNGNQANLTAISPSSVSGDGFYGDRFVYTEVNAARRAVLTLLDPTTKTRTPLLESTCAGNSWDVRTTSTRLFVADCNGLTSR